MSLKTLRIKRNENRRGLIDSATEISGVAVDSCLQCKRCSSGCPLSGHSASSPSEIIRHLQLGAGDELLAADIIWNCVSCQTCFSRCPMKINMAEVMDALKILAREKGAAKPAGNMPLMNRILLGTIKTFGRTYDLGAMALYKVGSRTFFRDTGKLPVIINKGKMALFPPRGADRKKVKQIFKNLMKTRKQ